MSTLHEKGLKHWINWITIANKKVSHVTVGCMSVSHPDSLYTCPSCPWWVVSTRDSCCSSSFVFWHKLSWFSRLSPVTCWIFIFICLFLTRLPAVWTEIMCPLWSSYATLKISKWRWPNLFCSYKYCCKNSRSAFDYMLFFVVQRPPREKLQTYFNTFVKARVVWPQLTTIEALNYSFDFAYICHTVYNDIVKNIVINVNAAVSDLMQTCGAFSAFQINFQRRKRVSHTNHSFALHL